MTQRLEESIEELARRDRRYPPEAYLMVFEGLECALARLPVRRHVAPVELLEGLRDRALEQWGLMARSVLESWNVCRARDVGDMVFNLVERGLLVAGEEDDRADFDASPEFAESFDGAFLSELDRNPPQVHASRE